MLHWIQQDHHRWDALPRTGKGKKKKPKRDLGISKDGNKGQKLDMRTGQEMDSRQTNKVSGDGFKC